jgi:hypothetical protein
MTLPTTTTTTATQHRISSQAEAHLHAGTEIYQDKPSRWSSEEEEKQDRENVEGVEDFEVKITIEGRDQEPQNERVSGAQLSAAAEQDRHGRSNVGTDY